MKNVNLILPLSVATVLVTIAGCSQTSPTQTPAATSAPTKPEPVAALKEVVDAVQRDGATINVRDRGQFRFVASDVTYDVQKSDSLVSPYTGTVSFISQDAIPSSSKSEKDIHFRMTAKLAQQDGRWIVKDVERRVESETGTGHATRAMLGIPNVQRHSDGVANWDIDAWWAAFGGK